MLIRHPVPDCRMRRGNAGQCLGCLFARMKNSLVHTRQHGPSSICRVASIVETHSSTNRKTAMDRLDELAVLVAVLETGSLAAAGRRLRRSPPAITRTIAALEERVGAKLLERTTRRLAPTEAGLALAVQARAMLDLYAEAMQAPAEAALR